jgi:hypothetical protein
VDIWYGQEHIDAVCEAFNSICRKCERVVFKMKYTPKVYGHDWLSGQSLSFDKPVSIYNNVLRDTSIEDDGSLKVLLAFSEPEPFRVHNQAIIHYQKDFDLILASHPEILKNCSNARKIFFGVPWITDEESKLSENQEKQFCIFFICGAKAHLFGHVLRQ